MTEVQMHASHIRAWELDDLEDWIKKMEILLQDLICSGHTEAIADDCIVSNLLHSLIEVPSGSPLSEHWKFAARTWKADHSKNHDATWLILKTSMLDEIKELRADEVKHCAARPRKHAIKLIPLLVRNCLYSLLKTISTSVRWKRKLDSTKRYQSVH
eukprot:3935535-Rhodomonas_salina.1